MYYQKSFSAVCGIAAILATSQALAIDGGTLRVNPKNGWKAFEVISVGDNPTGDGFGWSMPITFDGLGASLTNDSTLRLQVNHEISDATISQVDLNLANFRTAISNMISGGTTGGVSFVTSAQQAYDRWTSNGGTSWISTSSPANTSFNRFCSGQSYAPNTFGNQPWVCRQHLYHWRRKASIISIHPIVYLHWI